MSTQGPFPTASICLTAAGVMAVLTLAPVPVQGQAFPLQLMRLDRTGQVLGPVGPPGAFRGVDPSRDGERIAAVDRFRAAHDLNYPGNPPGLVDARFVETLRTEYIRKARSLD
jgi:hypothetical protein